MTDMIAADPTGRNMGAFRLDDLVRLPTGTLAFIDRMPGHPSDTESEESSSDSESDDDSMTDSRGRFARWIPTRPATLPTPRVSSNAASAAAVSSIKSLISTYDDASGPAADGHFTEQRRDTTIINTDTVLTSGTTGDSDQVYSSRNIPIGSALVSDAFTMVRTVIPLSDLALMDRSFQPGNVVLPADSFTTETQLALVENVQKTLLVRRVIDITQDTLFKPDPSTVFEVSSNTLGVISRLRAGDVVARRNWVGVVNHFQEEVYVRFDDGAIACVPGHRRSLENVDSRTPDRPKMDLLSEGLYYPGQRVRSFPEVWQNIAQWIRGNYTGRNEGVVKSVRIGEVAVEWVARSMFSGSDDEMLVGALGSRLVESVPFSDLSLVETFRSLCWTVGDRAFLFPSNHTNGVNLEHHVDDIADDDIDDESDSDCGWEEENMLESITTVAPRNIDVDVDGPSRARHKCRSSGGRLFKAQRRARERAGKFPIRTSSCTAQVSVSNPSAEPKDVVQVVGTRTMVDVLWQDGSREQEISALRFRQQGHPDPYNFCPGKIVRCVNDASNTNSSDQVPRTNPNRGKIGYLVRINKRQRTAFIKWNGAADGTEEEVSVYDLQGDEFVVNIGDTVMRVPKYGSTTHDQRRDFVGVIIGQREGKYIVHWNGGVISKAFYYELSLFLPKKPEDEEDDENDLLATDILVTDSPRSNTEDSDDSNTGLFVARRRGLIGD